MKQNFELPVMEIVTVAAGDVIATSSFVGIEDEFTLEV